MKICHKRSFVKSYVLRLIINIAFLVLLYSFMADITTALSNYNINISKTKISEIKSGQVFNTASYIFDETSIMITQAGLMVVALMTLIFGLDYFKIKPDESFGKFRFRLLLYTVAHLFSCLVVSLYLMCSVGLLSYPQSLRLNMDNSFVWSYPTFAIIAAIYMVELYKFFTENS